MADKAFEFGQTVLVFLTALGVAWWMGAIMTAKADEKLKIACAPIEFTADGVHELTTALIGYPPRWTLNVKAYLMGGCYYFFSIVLQPSEETGAVRGGVRY